MRRKIKKRKWTRAEEIYLKEKWGTISVIGISKKLGRSKKSVLAKQRRMKLGAFLEHGEYITWNQLQIVLCGTAAGSDYKMTSWVKKRGFPLRHKRINKKCFKVVFYDEWWEWAEKNKDILDFSKFEENILGEEPAWVKEKRRHDIERTKKYITTPWTEKEDAWLIALVEKQQYTYAEISSFMRRSNGAIALRLYDLGINARPLRADNHTKWTGEEIKMLRDLIQAGYGYNLLAEHIGKSAKACRGKVYQTYHTENLDKVRAIMEEKKLKETVLCTSDCQDKESVSA